MSKLTVHKISLLAALFLISLLFLDMSPKVVQAACSNCRVYASTYLADQQYTAVHAFIGYANPNINDGPTGFSAEVIWIGDVSSGKTIEIGWRQQGALQGESQYWAYFDASGGFHGPYWQSANYTGHDYQIEYRSSDNNWHVFIDGSEKGSISSSTVGYTSGFITSGAESTDLSSSDHNAVGIAGFTNLSFKRVGDTGYYSWSGIGPKTLNYDYWLNQLSYNSFQNGGHN